MKVIFSVFLGLFVQLSALAQSDIASYPNKPIRLILTTAAGGGSDAVARTLES